MADEAAVRAGQNYAQALHEFGYDERNPLVERGEVIRLAGHKNDQRLIEMRYFLPVKKGTELHQCGECGKRFIDEQTRRVHGDTWHQDMCPDCGQSFADVDDPIAALRHHRSRCPLVRDSRAEDRQQHFQVVKELATAGT